MDIATLLPEAYPPQLKELPDQPKRLFVRGTQPPRDALYLTVVGSRKNTAYGKAACEKIIRELAACAHLLPAPLVVVSGLAYGIDTAAHEAALAEGLPTIAFPGSGLSDRVLYPAGNRHLAERITRAGGALISEFDPETKAAPYTFPQRNRLMAGIARGVLIVEAAPRSGTLITARLALDYNRDVFAIPGSIFSEASRGAHDLLRAGAAPVAEGDDILRAWGIEPAEQADKNELPADLSDDEKTVFAALREPAPTDELAAKTNLPIHTLQTALSGLEIKGIITISAGVARRRG